MQHAYTSGLAEHVLEHRDDLRRLDGPAAKQASDPRA